MAIHFENRYIDTSTDELYLTDYLQTIISNWCMILWITLALAALGAAYAFIARPVYRADVLFRVVDRADNNSKDGVSSQTATLDTRPSTAADMQMLKSRLVTEPTVRALHLDISAKPRELPVIGPLFAGLVNGKWGVKLPPSIDLSGYAWGKGKITVSRFDTPKEQYDKTFTLIALQNENYVLQDPGGVAILEGHVGEDIATNTALGPIALRVDSLEGPPGMYFELVRESTLTTVDRLQKAVDVGEVAQQSGVIRASLEGYDSKLTADILNSMAREFIRQDIDSSSFEAAHMLAFLDQQLPRLRADLDAAEDRYNKFLSQHGTVDLSEESRLLLQQVVDNKTRLIDLQQQRAEMSQHFTDNYPAVKALDAQIAQLQGAQATMTRNVAALPNNEQATLRLMRDVHVDTELYTNLLNSAQQLRIAQAGQVGDVRIVDFAEPPDDPVRPKRVLVILGSVGAGLVLGTLFAFVRKTLYGGIEQTVELESALGLPVFAVVPRSQQQLRLQQNVTLRRRGLHVLAEQAPQDRAVEGVRSLRTSLQLSLGSASNNVVMLTGSRPDAGKSFLSVNLSALIASANKRVLVIDGDMRRGDIHSHFGVTHQPGLSDVLSGGELHAAIRHEVLPGLDVLPKGSLPSHPSELLMSARFDSLLKELKLMYDLVIIDTPPVLAVTDSTVIGRHAGTSLLVIRHGRQPIGELTETVTRLRNGGVELKGALLTDVPQTGAFIGPGYRGGYYGYESIAG